MVCNKCGKEVKDGELICSECGTAIENIVDGVEKSNIVAEKESTIGDSPTQTKPINRNFRKIPYIVIVAVVVALLFLVIKVFGGPSDDDYINAACQVASNPASGNWVGGNYTFNNGKVVDKDKYGRAIVLLEYDSYYTGASQMILCIYNYDTSQNTFNYYKSREFSLGGYDISEGEINSLKDRVNWDEPID